MKNIGWQFNCVNRKAPQIGWITEEDKYVNTKSDQTMNLKKEVIDDNYHFAAEKYESESDTGIIIAAAKECELIKKLCFNNNEKKNKSSINENGFQAVTNITNEKYFLQDSHEGKNFNIIANFSEIEENILENDTSTCFELLDENEVSSRDFSINSNTSEEEEDFKNFLNSDTKLSENKINNLIPSIVSAKAFSDINVAISHNNKNMQIIKESFLNDERQDAIPILGKNESLGSIKITIKYEEEMSRLFVKIHEAK